MEELKPCPFCGGKAKFEKKGYINSNHTVGFSCVIACAKCGCTPIQKTADITVMLLDDGEVKLTDVGIVARDNLIFMWNQRAEERVASEKM